MKSGHLSEYFLGVAAKTLAATEIDPETSRGHEYQGVDAFRQFLGAPSEKQKIDVTYVRLDDDQVPLKLESSGTWYNSRKNQPHRSAEYRLYYSSEAEDVVYKAKPGDSLFFCLPKEGPLLAVSCPSGSSVEQQLFWLFGLVKSEEFKGNQHDLRKESGSRLDYTARSILELIEIEVAAVEDEWLERILEEFGSRFPATSPFSTFARKHLSERIDAIADPDGALLAWIDFEERLFKTLERHLVADRLKQGFIKDSKADVDGFVSFSLSVQNRRKARAGAALENHLQALFDLHELRFNRGAETENRNKPDFLFPGATEYHDTTFPAESLTMLGAKSTCKDRWRQVLSEANRIEEKHLVTLEPGISKNQTDEMSVKKLRLVLPSKLHGTYQTSQQPRLMKLDEFISLVKQRQKG